MIQRLVVVSLLAAPAGGCGHDTNGDQPAPIDAPVDQAIDAPRLGAAKSRTLFVNTDGVTVLPGHHDATTNRSTLANAPTQLSPFLEMDPDRQAKIDDIVDQLRLIVAPYQIAIETTRPAAGPYHMVVLTDSPATTLGLAAGIPAITPSTCNSEPSVIAFEFGYEGNTEQFKRDFAVKNAIAMFADLAAIPLSRKPGDCMCLVADICAFLPAPCTIGGEGTKVDHDAGCPTAEPTMNEAALFLDVFGPRER